MPRHGKPISRHESRTAAAWAVDRAQSYLVIAIPFGREVPRVIVDCSSPSDMRRIFESLNSDTFVEACRLDLQVLGMESLKRPARVRA